jgi:hypothetical protein
MTVLLLVNSDIPSAETRQIRFGIARRHPITYSIKPGLQAEKSKNGVFLVKSLYFSFGVV